jgi:hypothetical protein
MSRQDVAINGKYYDWRSIRFDFLGRSVTEVAAIKYEEVDEIKGVQGVGSKDLGHTQGNTVITASITLYAEALEDMQRALPGRKRIQDIAPFDINVSFIDSFGILQTHVLEGVKFTKNGREGTSGNADALTTEIPLYVRDINWNA